MPAYSGCLRSTYTTYFTSVPVTVARSFRNLLRRSQLRCQSLIHYFTPGSETQSGTQNWSRNTTMSPDRTDSRSRGHSWCCGDLEKSLPCISHMWPVISIFMKPATPCPSDNTGGRHFVTETTRIK